MASYDNLSDSELREKLLEIGLDLPVSINREFLIKKLKSATESPNQTSTTKNGNRRRSLGRVVAVEEEIQPKKSGRGKSRLSLGVDVNLNSGGVKTSSSSAATTTGSPGTKRRSQTTRSSTSTPHQDISINNVHNNNANANTSTKPTTPSRDAANKSRFLTSSPLNSILDDSEDDLPPPANSSIKKGHQSSSASTAGDVSWSRKSTPQEWSRYSSIFSSTPPLSASLSPSASPFSTSTGLPSTSQSLNNGNWNHHNHSSTSSSNTASATSRFPMMSGMTRRSLGFANDLVTSVDRHSSSSNAPGHTPADRGHLISKILVGVAILGFAVIALLYLNLSNDAGKAVPGLNNVKQLEKPSKTPSTPTSIRKEGLSNNYPICGMQGVDKMACIQRDDVKPARLLFQTLKDELVQRARWKGCSFNVEDKVSLNAAKHLLYRLSDKKKQDVDDVFNGMLILCAENPNWGLKIEKDESTELLNPKELLELDYNTVQISATNVGPSFFCQIWSYVQVAVMYLVAMLIVVGAIYGVYRAVVLYQKKKKEEADTVYIFVENILQMLQEQYELAKETGGDAFLAVNHIRDSMISAKDRLKKAALWTKVVDYISNYESRVREEIQHISGEEFRVWRWLPNASPLSRSRNSVGPSSGSFSQQSTPPNVLSSTNHARSPVNTPMPPPSNIPACESPSPSPSSPMSKWQGQAFELSDGSPYALPISPTNCLKIRQMFDLEASNENRQARIESAILEKCPDSHICHIGVSHGSTEGCVYVKCATKEDARKAYLALHGWWFDGHLLSVKFLREENYVLRFPEARNRTAPLTRRY